MLSRRIPYTKVFPTLAPVAAAKFLLKMSATCLTPAAGTCALMRMISRLTHAGFGCRWPRKMSAFLALLKMLLRRRQEWCQKAMSGSRKIIRMPHRWMPSAVGVMPPPFAVNGRWQRYYLSFRERKLFDIGDPRKCPVSASREACGGWRACASAEHRPEDSPQLADPAGVLCSQ